MGDDFVIPEGHPRTVAEVVEKLFREGRPHPELADWLRRSVVPLAGAMEIAGLTREEFDEAMRGGSRPWTRLDGLQANIVAGHVRGFWWTLRHCASALVPRDAETALFERKRQDSRARIKAESCVYFIEAVGQGLVKIGKGSGRPEGRMAVLQTGSGHDLRMLYAAWGWDYEEERALHKKFKHLLVRGEWYRLTPEIQEHIESLRKAEGAR